MLKFEKGSTLSFLAYGCSLQMVDTQYSLAGIESYFLWANLGGLCGLTLEELGTVKGEYHHLPCHEEARATGLPIVYEEEAYGASYQYLSLSRYGFT